MVDEPMGWGRLRSLLRLPTWTREEAVFIAAGLDPAAKWLDWGDSFAWLPAGLPPEWRGLTLEQKQRRAERAVMVADIKLSGLPISIMPPRYWLFEVMARKQVQPYWNNKAYIHPGIIPPWLPQARDQPGFQLLLPPLLYPQAHRAKQGHAGQPSAKQRSIVRRMWDAWSLGECSYPDKAAFIRGVERVLDKHSPGTKFNSNSIGNLITEYEHQNYFRYGRYYILFTNFDPGVKRLYQDQSSLDQGVDTEYLGYAPHSIMEPAKKHPCPPR